MGNKTSNFITLLYSSVCGGRLRLCRRGFNRPLQSAKADLVFIAAVSTVNCQLSTVNCQLSTVNCQLNEG